MKRVWMKYYERWAWGDTSNHPKYKVFWIDEAVIDAEEEVRQVGQVRQVREIRKIEEVVIQGIGRHRAPSNRRTSFRRPIPDSVGGSVIAPRGSL
mgnify:CR=1 FL=1